MRKIFIVIATLALVLMPISNVNANDSVTVSVNQEPYLDVVLSVGSTDSPLSTFKDDLESLLVARGIDLGKINISSITSSNVSASDTSSGWEKYSHTNFPGDEIAYYRPYYNDSQAGSTYSGTDPYTGLPYQPQWNVSDHIAVTEVDGKQNIAFMGYGSPAYKDFMYMPNTESGKKTIEFTVEEGSFYDALDGAGFLFNTHLSSNTDLANRTMSGYLIFFRYGSNRTPQLLLYKFENVDVNAFHNSTSSLISNTSGFTLIDQATGSNVPGAETTRKVRIEATTTSVKVKYNDADVSWATAGGVDVTLPTAYSSYGFGPITSYSSHGCARPTLFTFNNITMSTESSKKFVDVLLEPEWREGSSRFIVNAQDGADPDFSDAVELGKIVTKLGNEAVNYIGWGKAPTDGNALISKNEGNGLYIDKNAGATNSYNNQLIAMADYIESIYKSDVVRDTDTLIYGRENDLVITPNSAQTDTIDSDWPSGKWKVVHDENHFANPTGTVPYHDIYLNNLEINFSQTGKYSIYYRDNLEKEVFVHRLPVALFTVTLDGSNNVSITNLSYDLDTGSNPLDGITQSNFFYRESTSDIWINGQPTTLDINKEYIFKLVVVDTLGVSSNPAYYKYISTSSGTLAPVAEFKTNAPTYFRGVSNPVTYLDTSYDPQGEAISSRTWIIYNKDGAEVYNDTIAVPTLDFATLSEGTYKISLQVTDASGQTSEFTSRFVDVFVDSVAPTGSLLNSTTTYNAPFILNTYFEDNTNGSGLSHRYIVLTNDTTTPTDWGTIGSTNLSSISISDLGTYYLHYRAVDLVGNEKISYLGPIVLEDTTAPSAANLTSTPNFDFTSDVWTKDDVSVSADGSTDDFTDALDILYQVSTNGTDYASTTSFSANSEGEYDVYFKTIDEAGNESIKQIKIYIDRTAPTFDSITPQTIESGISNVDWASLIVNNNDNLSTSLTNQELTDDVDYNTPGVYIAEVESVDQAGNSHNVYISVTVEDTTNPSFSVIPAQTIEAGSTAIEWEALIINKIDNSDTTLTTRVVSDDVDYDTVSSYTVEVGLADLYGNEVTQSFVVNVVDTTAPSFDTIGSQTITLGTADIDWTTYIKNIVDAGSSTFSTLEVTDEVDYTKVGTYQVKVSVEDEYGNIGEQTFEVSIKDVKGPTFNNIGIQKVEAGSSDVDWSTLIENLNDDSPGEILTSEVIDNVDYDTPGSYIALVSAKDVFGNKTSKNVIIEVVDTTKPTFSFAGSSIIEAGSDVIDWINTITNTNDNSDGALRKSTSDDIDYDIPGTYNLRLQLSDLSGNVTVKSIEVTVVDTISPTFDDIEDQMIDQFSPEFNWSLLIENGRDNSNQPMIYEVVEDNVNYDELGAYTVIVSLSDQSGNVTEKTINVTVNRVVTIIEEPENAIVIVANGELIVEDDPEKEDQKGGVSAVTFTVKEKDGEVTYKTVYKTDPVTGERTELGTGISLQDEAFVVEQGDEIEIPLTDFVEDFDMNNVTITINGQPSNGEIEIDENGVITYTSEDGFIGLDATVIEISDGNSTVSFVASFDVQESEGFITVQCLINWVLGIILLAINYLLNKAYYTSKSGRTIKYTVVGALFIVFLCLLSRIFGPTIPYMLLAGYFVFHYYTARREIKTNK
jgi:hypothetical protein